MHRNSGPDKGPIKAVIGVAIGLVLLTIVATFLVNVIVIEGQERGVVQDWNNGVLAEVLTPGTHFYMPFKTKIYIYDVGVDNFMMGKTTYYTGEGTDFADFPEYRLTTGGSGKEQQVDFSVTMQYYIDEAKLTQLHSYAQNQYKNKLVKPAVIASITKNASKLDVVDFFSGQGRIDLSENLTESLKNLPSFTDNGIIVTNFVLNGVDPDKDWLDPLLARQIAKQNKLKEIEETLAAEETAKKVEALAQANKLKRIVEAEASKQEKIKAAEASNESRILAAKANAEEIKQKATAERYRKEQDAKGLLAQGLAEAKVHKEKRDSKYSGVAGERQASVEIAKAKVALFSNANISGIIPEKTFLTLINGDGNNKPQLTLPVTSQANGESK